MSNESNAHESSYSYDAFGIEQIIYGNSQDPSTDNNPFRYCGEYFDTESGTYYLRARYYNPRAGRFTQEDAHWTNVNRIYGDNPQKINEREDKLGLKTYSYSPDISAIMQSGNLYVYALNNPMLYADLSGDFVVTAATLLVGGAILVFGTAGGVIGSSVADQNGVTGWQKALYVAVGTAIGSVGGAVLASSAVPITTATVAAGVATVGGVAAESTVTATGQLHHILSNPIMRALNAHPSLSGLFNRSDAIVRALTPEAHKGYQTWHRFIDNKMVQWLSDPFNQRATPQQFWQKLYELYSTPDMIERFGESALNLIEELMK